LHILPGVVEETTRLKESKQRLEAVACAISIFDHTDKLHEIVNIILMWNIDGIAIHKPKVVSDHRAECGKRQPTHEKIRRR